MKIEIKNRYDGRVIFSMDCERAESVTERRRAAILSAIKDGVSLSRADLSGAILSGADLSRADLSGAILSRADLSRADLDAVKADLWLILAHAPNEVRFLINALNSGKVNGRVYSDGDCGCLIGTLAMASGADSKSDCESVHGIKGNPYRPAERWFYAIAKGDTPETSQIAKIARDWCVEWLDRMETAFGRKRVTQ